MTSPVWGSLRIRRWSRWPPRGRLCDRSSDGRARSWCVLGDHWRHLGRVVHHGVEEGRYRFHAQLSRARGPAPADNRIPHERVPRGVGRAARRSRPSPDRDSRDLDVRAVRVTRTVSRRYRSGCPSFRSRALHTSPIGLNSTPSMRLPSRLRMLRKPPPRIYERLSKMSSSPPSVAVPTERRHTGANPRSRRRRRSPHGRGSSHSR